MLFRNKFKYKVQISIEVKQQITHLVNEDQIKIALEHTAHICSSILIIVAIT